MTTAVKSDGVTGDGLEPCAVCDGDGWIPDNTAYIARMTNPEEQLFWQRSGLASTPLSGRVSCPRCQPLNFTPPPPLRPTPMRRAEDKRSPQSKLVRIFCFIGATAIVAWLANLLVGVPSYDWFFGVAIGYVIAVLDP